MRLSSQLERLPDRSPGRLINLQIAGKHPFGTDRRACRATRRGTRRGVCFATHAPAAVIQTVVHCMLQNRFAAFRTRRVAGKHKGKANSRVRHLPDHCTHDTQFNSMLSRAFWCVIAWVVCSRLTVKRYNLCIKEAPHTNSSCVFLRMFSGTTESPRVDICLNKG